MREGGKPLPLAFQYLIFLVIISSLASKCHHFKLRGLQFYLVKWLKIRHFNFKVLAFLSRLSQSIEIVGLVEYIDKLGYTGTYASIAISFLPKLQLWVKKIKSAYICM